MIEVVRLTKIFDGTLAVDEISFSLQKGQTLAILGTSGSGKTTTLKMINRLIEPTGGAIWIDHQNIMSWKVENLRRKMGYVIQGIGLFPHYTVEENIAVGPKLLQWDKQKIRQKVNRLLDQLRLPREVVGKYPFQLSGGQQQRVGIARALAADPPIILMDEPFGALDPVTRQEIRKDFLELEDLANKTTILVTHDIKEAFEMGNLVCLMDAGRIQQMGTAMELLFHPANAFVEKFFQNHLLELKLQILCLKDLFTSIHPVPDSQNRPAISLSPKTTLLQAIEIMTTHPKEAKYAKVSWQGTEKIFDLAGLMECFQK